MASWGSCVLLASGQHHRDLQLSFPGVSFGLNGGVPQVHSLLAMQVMGGIGYTNVFSIERIIRDLRLASIWVGTNEVMSMIIGHEWYREHAEAKRLQEHRDFEADSAEAGAEEEKIYE